MAKAKTGKVTVGKLTIEVKVLDSRDFYGNMRHLVTPVRGSGQAWMEKVQLDGPAARKAA